MENLHANEIETARPFDWRLVTLNIVNLRVGGSELVTWSRNNTQELNK